MRASVSPDALKSWHPSRPLVLAVVEGTVDVDVVVDELGVFEVSTGVAWPCVTVPSVTCSFSPFSPKLANLNKIG
jgi:hypothetical protein